MYKLTNTSSIIRLSDFAHIPADKNNRDYAAYLKWVAEGNPPEPVDPPTPAQVIATYTAAVQQRLDAFARTRGYDSILSACTYATSTVTKFATEGQYAVDMRDTTWALLYNLLAEVESGDRPMPTRFDDIESELPELIWPE